MVDDYNDPAATPEQDAGASEADTFQAELRKIREENGLEAPQGAPTAPPVGVSPLAQELDQSGFFDQQSATHAAHIEAARQEAIRRSQASAPPPPPSSGTASRRGIGSDVVASPPQPGVNYRDTNGRPVSIGPNGLLVPAEALSPPSSGGFPGFLIQPETLTSPQGPTGMPGMWAPGAGDIYEAGRFTGVAASQVPGGAISGVGSVLQAPDVVVSGVEHAGQASRLWLRGAMDAIDRGEAVAFTSLPPRAGGGQGDPQEDDRRRMLIARYQRATPEQRVLLRTELQGEIDAFSPTPIQSRPLYRAGEAVQEYGRTLIPLPEGYTEQSFSVQLGRGLGSMLTGLPATWIGGPAGGALVFGPMGMGEATQRAVRFDQAERAAGRPGLTQEQIISAGLLGVGPGTTDILPVETLLGRLPLPIPPALRTALARSIARVGGQAIVEGVQEGGQQFLQNLIAWQVYNPNQVLTEEIIPNLLVGSAVGGVAQTAGEVGRGVMGLGRRGGRSGTPSPTPEAAPSPTPAPGAPPVQPGAPSVDQAAPQAAPETFGFDPRHLPPPEATLGAPEAATAAPQAEAPTVAQEAGTPPAATGAAPEGVSAAPAPQDAEQQLLQTVERILQERPDVVSQEETEILRRMAERFAPAPEAQAEAQRQQAAEQAEIERVVAENLPQWRGEIETALQGRGINIALADQDARVIAARMARGGISATEAIEQHAWEAYEAERQARATGAVTQQAAPAAGPAATAPAPGGATAAAPAAPAGTAAAASAHASGRGTGPAAPTAGPAAAVTVPGEPGAARSGGARAASVGGERAGPAAAPAAQRAGADERGVRDGERAAGGAAAVEAPPAGRRYTGPALSDVEIDVIADNWKYVREFFARPRPVSLTNFIVRSGGIEDRGGDVRSLAGSIRSRPGLVRRAPDQSAQMTDLGAQEGSGLSLDDWALRAWEVGYFPFHTERPTINEFLDKLQDDLRTGTEVPAGDETYFEDAAVAAEMEAELADYGITTRDFRKEETLRAYLGQPRAAAPRQAEGVEGAQAADVRGEPAAEPAQPITEPTPAQRSQLRGVLASRQPLNWRSIQAQLETTPEQLDALQQEALNEGLLRQTKDGAYRRTPQGVTSQAGPELSVTPEDRVAHREAQMGKQVSPAVRAYGVELLSRLGSPSFMATLERAKADKGLSADDVRDLAAIAGTPVAPRAKKATAFASIQKRHEDHRAFLEKQAVEAAVGVQLASFAEADSSGQSQRAELDALGFYSKALEAAKAWPQKKGTPEQALQHLLKAGAGVKNEIEALGLNTFLEGKKSVSRDDLVSYLREHRVEVREANYAGDDPAVGMGFEEVGRPYRSDEDESVQIQDYEERRTGYRYEVHVDRDAGNVSVRTQDGEWLNVPGRANRQRISDALAAMESHATAMARASGPAGIVGPAKWSHYSLAKDDGNPTYRETVLHLPEATSPEWRAFVREMQQKYAADGATADDWWAYLDEQDSARRLDIARTNPDADADAFRSGHWSEPNVIGNLMTSLNQLGGTTTFAISQIQSDWSQAIRDRTRDAVAGQLFDPAKPEVQARVAGLRERLQAAHRVREAYLVGEPLQWVRTFAPVLAVQDGLNQQSPDPYNVQRALGTVVQNYPRGHAGRQQAEAFIADPRNTEPGRLDRAVMALQQSQSVRYHDLPDDMKAEVSAAISEARQRGELPAGARDEKKIAGLKKRIETLKAAPSAGAETQDQLLARLDLVAQDPNNPERFAANDVAQSMRQDGWTPEQFVDQARYDGRQAVEDMRRLLYPNHAALAMAEAELATAEAATPSHPFVNTTDQWLTTTLRQVIRQAIAAGADSISIPSGATVLDYNLQGSEEGNEEFYNKIVPISLGKILKGMDSSIKSERVATVQSPVDGRELGQGFTVFPITDKVREYVERYGQSLMALQDRFNPPEQPGPYSAIFASSFADFHQALETEFRRMVPAPVAIELVDKLVNQGLPSYEVVGGPHLPVRRGDFRGFGWLLSVALEHGPKTTRIKGFHGIAAHILRGYGPEGLYTPKEWRSLVDLAVKLGIKKELQSLEVAPSLSMWDAYVTVYAQYGPARQAEYLDQELVGRLAEHYYADFEAGADGRPERKRSYGAKIDALLDRIAEFLVAIRQALNRIGITQVDQLFEPAARRAEIASELTAFETLDKARSGEIARRADGGRREPTFNPFPNTPSPSQAHLFSGEGQEARGLFPAIRAFHGSPHDFDRFDITKIGTGEGAQAFGHGLYFAGNERVAENYKTSVTRNTEQLAEIARSHGLTGDGAEMLAHQFAIGFGGQRFNDWIDGLRDALDDPLYVGRSRAAAQQVVDNLVEASAAVSEMKSPGRLYEVSLDVEPEQLLDWDKPLGEQSEAVRKAIDAVREAARERARAADAAGDQTAFGQAINEAAALNLERGAIGDAMRVAEIGASPARFAQLLREAGIKGIRYLDAGSRAAGEGSRNFVIFDDSLVKIVSKDGKPVASEERADVLQQMHQEQEGGDSSANLAAFSSFNPFRAISDRIWALYVNWASPADRAIGPQPLPGERPYSEQLGGMRGIRRNITDAAWRRMGEAQSDLKEVKAVERQIQATVQRQLGVVATTPDALLERLKRLDPASPLVLRLTRLVKSWDHATQARELIESVIAEARTAKRNVDAGAPANQNRFSTIPALQAQFDAEFEAMRLERERPDLQVIEGGPTTLAAFASLPKSGGFDADAYAGSSEVRRARAVVDAAREELDAAMAARSAILERLSDPTAANAEFEAANQRVIRLLETHNTLVDAYYAVAEYEGGEAEAPTLLASFASDPPAPESRPFSIPGFDGTVTEKIKEGGERLRTYSVGVGIERPVRAAVQMRGEVFEGSFHGDAYANGLIKLGQVPDNEVVDGFVTDRGRFVTRAEASRLASAIGYEPAATGLAAGDLTPMARTVIAPSSTSLIVSEQPDGGWELTFFKAEDASTIPAIVAAIEANDLRKPISPKGWLTPQGYQYWLQVASDRVKFHVNAGEMFGGMWASPRAVEFAEAVLAEAAARGQDAGMSREDKLARARSLGFDTTRVWYHGTKDFVGDAFDVKKRGRATGVSQAYEAFWFTSSPEVASGYGLDLGGEYAAGAAVLPVYVRGNLFEIRPSRLAREGRPKTHYDAFEVSTDGGSSWGEAGETWATSWGEKDGTFTGGGMSGLAKAVRDHGFAGVAFHGLDDTIDAADSRTSVILGIFDPSNIRPINDQFQDAASADNRGSLSLKGTESAFAHLSRLKSSIPQEAFTEARREERYSLASRPTLDISPEARKARAEAMGFDTSRVLYRGQSSDRQFPPRPYFTDRPEIADLYAGGGARPEYTGGNITPVWAKASKVLVLERDTAKFEAAVRELGLPPGPPTNIDHIVEAAADHGYQLVELRDFADIGGETQTQYIPTSLANVRSVNATFDPSQEGSTVLLASFVGQPPGTSPSGGPQLPVTPASQGEVRGLADIISDLKSALGLTTTQGLYGMRVRDRAGGRTWGFRPQQGIRSQYDANAGVARIRVATDIDAIAREGGRHIEQVFGTPMQAFLSTHAEELAVSPVPDNPLPAIAPTGFSGIDLDADTQRALVDAADYTRQWQALTASGASQATRYDVAAQAAIARSTLQRRLGRTIADHIVADLVSQTAQPAADYVRERYSATGMPAARVAPTPSQAEISTGFADFFRRYITDPDTVKREMPGVYVAFEEFLDAQDPAMLQDLERVQLEVVSADYKAYRLATATDRLTANVASTRDQDAWEQVKEFYEIRDPRERVEQWLSGASYNVMDLTNPALKMQQHIQQIMFDNGVRGADGRPISFQKRELPHYHFRMFPQAFKVGHELVVNGVTDYGSLTPVGPALTDAIQEAMGGTGYFQWSDKNIDRFAGYMEAQTGIVYWALWAKQHKRPEAAQWAGLVNQYYNSPDIAQMLATLEDAPTLGSEPSMTPFTEYWQAIQETEQANQRYRRASQMAREWQHRLLTLKWQAGLLGDVQHQKYTKRREFYAPFNRKFDAEEGAFVPPGASALKTFGGFKQIKGSQRAVVNVLATMARDAYATAEVIQRNDMIRSFAELSDAAGPGGGQVVERITKEETMEANSRNFAKVASAIQALGYDEADAHAMALQMSEDFTDSEIHILHDPTHKGKGAVTLPFFEKGERKLVRFNDIENGRRLLAAMNTLGRGMSGVLVDMVAAPAAVLRSGVILHPAYMLGNVAADMQMAWWLTGAPPVLTHLRGGFHELSSYPKFRALMQRFGIKPSDVAQMQDRLGLIGGGQLTASIAERSGNRRNLDLSDLRNKGYQTVDIRAVAGTGSALSGLAAGATLGTVAGPVVGGLIGGSVGVATGASIGGAVGERMARMLRGDSSVAQLESQLKTARRRMKALDRKSPDFGIKMAELHATRADLMFAIQQLKEADKSISTRLSRGLGRVVGGAVGGAAGGLGGVLAAPAVGPIVGATVGFSGGMMAGRLLFGAGAEAAFAKLSEFSETAGRRGVAEYATRRALQYNPGIPMIDAMRDGAFTANDVLPFDRRGFVTGAIMRMIAFFNGNVQAISKAYRQTWMVEGDRGRIIQIPMLEGGLLGAGGAAAATAIFGGPVGWAMGAGALTGASVGRWALGKTDIEALKLWGRHMLRRRNATGPSEFEQMYSKSDERTMRRGIRSWVILSIVAAMGGALSLLNGGGDDPDEYADNNRETKNTHWVFKLFDVWVRLKRFEFGMPAVITEALLDLVVRGDPRAAEKIRDGIVATHTPPLTPQILREWEAFRYGIDPRTGRPIIPFGLRDLPPHMRATPFSSEFARQWAQFLHGVGIEVAPVMIDYGLSTQFGYWGREAQIASNMLVRGMPGDWREVPLIGPVVNRFTWDPHRSTESILEFRRIMRDGQSPYVQASAGYNQMMRDGASADALRTYLVGLPPDQIIYSVLMQHFSTTDRNTHPMNRAQQIDRVMFQIRREMAGQGAISTDAAFRGTTIALSPALRTQVERIMQNITALEMWNALHDMGRPGWANRSVRDPTALYRELQASAPTLYAELLRRFASSRLEDGSASPIGDYATDRAAWIAVQSQVIQRIEEQNLLGLQAAWDTKFSARRGPARRRPDDPPTMPGITLPPRPSDTQGPLYPR